MARSSDGTEFYLLEVTSADPEATTNQIETLTRSVMRGGDGIMIWRDQIFVAIVSGVPGAGKAARRLMSAMKEKGLETKVRLVSEPFQEPASMVAHQVNTKDLPIKKRPDVSWSG